MPRLRRSDPTMDGIRRRRRGRGFQYLDEHGETVTDPVVLERIRELAVPPAWREVWICPHDNGHIQAVGLDEAGRRQYRYHAAWRERADRRKFDDMLEFARGLPRLRRRARRHLAEDALSRSRVLACAARLLDLGFFRVGGEEYADEDGGYGLATLERRHARLRGGAVVFDYPAKSGQRRVLSIADRDVAAVLRELKRRRVPAATELLAYRNGHRWHDVRSGDINEYVRAATGFTSKHFRTWHGTVLAAVALGVAAPATRSRTGRTRAIGRAAQEVAHYLGNTPAVARASYIDPRVIDRFRSGETIHETLVGLPLDGGGLLVTHGPVERAVIALLEAS